jgi:2-amino-4-hydroxy-6-hydroxymethyldihydropteridine diphosphokinase
MREAVTAFVGVGGNLGQAASTVSDAMVRIGALPGTTLVRRSSLYRTAPVDSSGPDYVNAVAEIATRLDAPALLAALQALEDSAGRERPYRNAPRTLDLDLLLFGSARIDSPRLQVPHPRMKQRAFVLVPLAEIAPDRVSSQELQAVAGQHVTRIG